MESKNTKVLRKTLLAIDRAMCLHARNEATCCGVTLPQCHAITEIGLAGKASVKDLSDLLGLDKSTLSRTIDSLVAAGLIERILDAADRRYVVLSLSPSGLKTFEQINTIWHLFCAELMKNIPGKKHGIIIESMLLIVAALQKNDFGKKFAKKCANERK